MKPIELQPKANGGLFLIALVVFGVLVIWNSLQLPLGEAPDESDHLAVARFIAENGHPPRSEAERQAAGPKGGLAPFYYQVLALPLRLVDFSTLTELRAKPEQPTRYIPEDGLGFSRVLHTLDELPPYRGLALVWHWLRLTSLLFAFATLVTTYWLGHLLFKRRDLALAITLFVAFVPRFVISSAVLNDDNLVNFLIILFLLLLLKIVDKPEKPVWYFLNGVMLGFAILTKYNSLVLFLELPLVFGYLIFRRRLSWRRIFVSLGWTIAGLMLIAGPWYGFILVRFNRIDELGLVSGLVAALAEPQVTAGFLRHLNQTSALAGVNSYSPLEWLSLLYRSFWFEYGRMQLFAQPVYYWLYGFIFILALVGWGFYWKKRAFRFSALPFIYWLAFFHLLLFAAVPLGRYLLTPTLETTQGRQLFPALPVIGAIFIFGLGQLFTGRFYRAFGFGFAALGVIGNLAFLKQVVEPAYFYLSVTTGETDRFSIAVPRSEKIDEDFVWRGYSLDSTAQAGQIYPVRLYWQAEQALTQNYWLRLCLVDAAGQPAACQQGHFGAGRYPTRGWERHDFVEEVVKLPLPVCLAEGDYQLQMTVAAPDMTERIIREPLAIVYQADLPERIKVNAADMAAAAPSIWDQTGRQPDEKSLHLHDTMTLLSYGPTPPETVLVNERDDSWPAVGEATRLACPTQPAWLTIWTVDYGTAAGWYRFADSTESASVALPVEVRFRNYETAAEFTERFDDQLALQLTPDSTQTFWPGERVKLTALWQAQRLLSTAYLVSIRVLDQDFAVAGARDNTLGDRYPNVLWAPGEVVPETYFIPLDPNAPPGLYQLEFSLVEILDETNYRFLPIHLADETSVDHLYPMTIRMLDPAQAQFAPTQPTNFKIGSAINLIGFDLERPAEKVVDVALYWQTEAKPAADYTVFTQLIGPDGQVWGQQDNPPQAGRYPTGHWSASDRVVDRYHLTLREGAPVGQYRLLVGMYEPSSGTRLPVWDATGQPGPDNAILLSTIDVE